MKGYVYIITDRCGKYYIGSTANIEKRFAAHQNKHTRTTARMKNIKIVLTQEYTIIEMARNVERKIKKLKRRAYLEKIIKDGYIRTKI